MAPGANIILFEASDTGSGLYTAAQTAAGTAGVVVVSMSWSGNEFSGETSDNSFFSHAGVTFLAAAGDSGAYGSTRQTETRLEPQYPATSPNVVAVGGTTLDVSGYSWTSETVWGSGSSSGSAGGGGGGSSAYESQPSYQNGVVSAFSTTQRTYPDVSADANPNTGVPIYDSYDFGASTPWAQYGGTSLACPLWAGMISIADQGRSLAGLTSLGGASQTLPQLYKLASADFHDITSGSNGYSAGPGYDLASGIGSPVANLLIPQLVGPTQLAFGQAPTLTGANASMSPAVTVLVEDSLGNVVASDTSSVTVALGNNPGGGALSGTLTVAAVKGVATFNNLSLNQPGSGYTLVASDTTGCRPPDGHVRAVQHRLSADRSKCGNRHAESGDGHERESFGAGRGQRGRSDARSTPGRQRRGRRGRPRRRSRPAARMPRRTARSPSARPGPTS